ncbi:M14 family zinc carboxypeptidase [Humisphaera borealis]|uniref:Zinc carboxypeptidase n=1 Tax=Humisphaera borealis TaxID=2807512 RepID=A0A7M2X3L9_9BACT|nr:M14 family zinc carboxypeptidase [Humisphaera borealis]QOV92275.1 zinc carboxypeptidase [Humisphaera borealis]
MKTFVRASWMIVFAALLGGPTHALAADLSISIDFPSGSGRVQEIDRATRAIRLEPTPHKGRGWSCWWFVKVAGIAPGETITLTVGPPPWATPDHAAYSIDGGKSWLQTGKGERTKTNITYRQKIDAPEALFAWGPPFTPDDAAALVKEIASKVDGRDGVKAEVFELCKSNEGRSTPAVRLTPPASTDGARSRGLFVCARQHAWESGGSWVGRGFADFLVSDAPAAVALRKRTIVYFVPIMDIDNVAIGAGGKNQDPHDHNRDWTDKPVFPAVAAAQAIIRTLDKAGTFDLFVDLHNPAANDLKPFFFVSEQDQLSDLGKANLNRFVAESVKQITGPMALDPKTRPSGPAYDKNWRAISKNWVGANTHPGVVALTLETSWNTPNSNIQGYKTVGGQLGAAIAAYLDKKD